MHVYGRRRMRLLSSSWEAGDLGWYTNPSLSQTKCCSLFMFCRTTPRSSARKFAPHAPTHIMFVVFCFLVPYTFQSLRRRRLTSLRHISLFCSFFFSSSLLVPPAPLTPSEKKGITKNYKKIYNIHIIYKKERKLKKGGNEWGVHYTVHLLKREHEREKHCFFSTLVLFFLSFLHVFVVFAIALIVFAP